MRLALTLFTACSLLGCSDLSAPPTAPSPQTPPAPSGAVFAMVAEDSGMCIRDAKVEVVAGQGVGRTATQTDPCNVWDVGGIAFTGLQVGVEMTLRASAPGYVAREKTVLTSTGPWETLIFTLSKAR